MKQFLYGFLMLCYIGSSAQKMPIYLTFTASNNGQHVPLDSVLIENLTAGGDTILYTPDTVLVLNYIVSISDQQISNETSFTLSQNYPNPIKNKTTINLNLAESKNILITVYNILGEALLHQELMLDQGNHEFQFTPGNENIYILIVMVEKQLSTIKMLNSNKCSNPFNNCTLQYIGHNAIQSSHKIQNHLTNFEYNQGDTLKYTASTSMGYRIIYDSPVGNQTYVFQYSSAFPCPEIPTISDIDGNSYNTVLIGNQCWMKENLKTTTYNDGTPIQNIQDDSSWFHLTTGAYVWYENNITWKDSYGALYNWYSVASQNGLCPTGWHVPSKDEWFNLQYHIGGSISPYGNDLKSCRQVSSPLSGFCDTNEHPRWDQDSTHYGNDYYGFSGLPGGFRYEFGAFGNIGHNGYWWSSTETWQTIAWMRFLNYHYGIFGGCTGEKQRGFSVRCIKD